MSSNPISLSFPLGGLVENVPYAQEQGQGVVRADQALNMRPYDQLEERQRGGQRPGISRLIGSTPDLGAPVQQLGQIVEAVSGQAAGTLGSYYAQPSTAPDNNPRRMEWNSSGDVLFAQTSRDDANYRLYAYAFALDTGIGNQLDVFLNTDFFNNDTAFRDLAVHPNDGAIATAMGPEGLLIIPWDGSTFGTVQQPLTKSFINTAVFHPSGDYLAIGWNSSPYLEVYEYDKDAHTLGSKLANPSTLPGNTVGAIRFTPDGRFLVHGQTSSPYLAMYEFDADTGSIGDRFEPGNAAPEAVGFITITPDNAWAAVAGWNTNDETELTWIYPITAAGFGSPQEVANPSATTPFYVNGLRFSHGGNFLAAFYNGNAGDDRLYTWTWSGAVGDSPDNVDPDTNLIGELGYIAWHPSDEAIAGGGQAVGDADDAIGVVQFTGSGAVAPERQTRLLAVLNGDVYRSDYPPETLSQVGSGADVFAPNADVQLTAAFQNTFFCDGVTANYKYYDYSANDIKDWAANLKAGSLPQGSNNTDLACTIIATYRGRVVLSGLRESPHNWYMSKAGDPFDFDYSPSTTTNVQAVAGNNSDAGELSDVITALMPYNDDIMIMGGSRSLAVMRGDPAAGGLIDNISQQIGVVGKEAFCWSATNVLYFFGENGLYRMTPENLRPELVSGNKLDRTFGEIDLDANTVRLAYNNDLRGVHIFVTPLREPDAPVDQYWYDERTDSFWRDQYPPRIGPTAVLSLTATRPDKRGPILGGFDGQLRRMEAGAQDDDGDAIDSFVRLPAIHPGVPAAQFQLSDLQIHLDEQSDDVTLSYYRARTAEQVRAATTAQFTKTLTGGRNLPVRYRMRGHALQIELRNNAAGETWAYEDGMAVIQGVGRQRATL